MAESRFGTTHAQRVAMLSEYELDDLNGMWVTLLEQGTADACQAFAAAMEDGGYTLKPQPDTLLADVILWRLVVADED